jgi:galactokinase
MTPSERAAELNQHYQRAFGGPPARLVRAPGRVNLIGEHTDYNDGFVLPAAIEREVLMAAGRSDDASLEVISTDFRRRAAFDLSRLEPSATEPWANYVAGVAWALKEAGHSIGGARIALQSTIPHGSGLSSSAALELATALAFQGLFGLSIERPALAKLCQRAENEFVGMPCGIMDQFIAALGREGHALLLDCRSLDYEHVPVTGAALVMANSGVRRELVDSEYRVRRSQCESAVAKLAAALPGIRALRDVSSEDLRGCAHLLSPVELRRARHVVSENERTLQAAAALRTGNLAQFGVLMVASHESLRDDYEVSCPQLDLLVELALKMPGVYGSRMTGAGFGGCTITLARPEAAAALQAGLARRYREAAKIEPLVFASAAAAGAGEVAA